MNLAKVSNGKIIIPIEIRRKLSIKEGDKIIFLEKPNGEIVLQNSRQQPSSRCRQYQFLEKPSAEQPALNRSEKNLINNFFFN